MKNILIPISKQHKIKLLVFALLFANFQIFKFSNCLAQVPQKFNYQGIARDAKGNPMAKQQLTLKLSVLPTFDATVPEYEEVQYVLTNEFGLYTLQIGNGTALTGEMKTVKWETGNKYIKVMIDPKGGNDFLDAGTTQLLSVPYAIYADKAGMAKIVGGDRTGTVSSNATHVSGDSNYLTKFTGLNVIGKSLVFDNGTNLGIGTTSPIARLHMTSNVATPQEHIRMENLNTLGAGRFTMYNNDVNAFATFTKYGTTAVGGSPGISALYPFANLLAFGNNQTGASGNGRFLISTEGNTGISLLKDGNAKLKLHIDYATERVGIGGNAVPASQVHFNNTAGSQDTIKFTNNTMGHTATDGLEIRTNGNNGRLINRENAFLLLGTNNTDRIAITGAGNVGIGTIAPAATLDVNGQVRIQGGTPGTGKVLMSDSTGLATWQKPGIDSQWASNGPHIFNNNIGNVGIGTNTPKARFHVIDSSVVFSANGDTNSSTFNNFPPIEGAGRRMMWYPERGAFRAGSLSGSDSLNWNRDSIGLYSIAIGLNTKATDRSAFASGNNTTASGEASTAIGNNTTASGFASTAMGRSTTTSGFISTAMGESTIASGSASTAMGLSTTASGFISTAMGSSTTASGDRSTTMGESTTASGTISTAIGINTTASGTASTAMGQNTTASGNRSNAMGLSTISSGDNSTAMGSNTRANGFASLAIGRFNDSIVASQTSIQPTTPLFIVGNGTSDSLRKNAMVVQNDGRVGIGSNLPLARLHVSDSSVVFSAVGDTSIITFNNKPPIEGEGRRMMWYPEKGAFRAGGIAGSDSLNWNKDSIGAYSVAMGWKTKAKGKGSISLGDKTSANGNNSIATGFSTTANGSASFVSGNFSTANGNSSTSFGSSSTANGFSSTAFGTLTIANGMKSTTMGNSTISNGFSSLVIGQFNDTIVATQTTMQSTTPLFIIGNGTSNSIRTNVMVVRNDGRVGIGTSAPTNQLTLSTNSAAKPTSSTWTISSDARLKTVDGTYTRGLADVLKLNTVTYHYNKGNARNLPTEEQGYGFVAQELQNVYPEAVKENEDGYLSVDFHPVLVSYINAIKELNTTNELQNSKIDVLEKQNQLLQQQIDELKVMIKK